MIGRRVGRVTLGPTEGGPHAGVTPGHGAHHPARDTVTAVPGPVGVRTDVIGQTERGPATTAAQLVDAGVGGDPVQPRPEGAATVEASDRPYRREQRVLGGIDGVGLMAEHATAQRVDAVVVRDEEGLQGLAVPSARRVEHLRVVVSGG